MHPKLRSRLSPYYEGQAIFTVVRNEAGSIGWVLSRDDSILTWDGWHGRSGHDGLNDLPSLPRALDDERVRDMDDVRGVNAEHLSRCFGMIALFGDSEFGPDFLAQRITDPTGRAWGRRSVTNREKADLWSADPLAYFVLGAPEDLRNLAEAVE